MQKFDRVLLEDDVPQTYGISGGGILNLDSRELLTQ